MNQAISERQLEIIASAGKILSLSGVSGLTIKNLAKEMNFSESAIYRHFASKEDIIIAMLDHLADTMDERYSKAVVENQSPKEKFKALFQNQFSFFNSNPYFVAAVFSDGLMEHSDRINRTILKIMAVKIKHLKPIVHQGQQEGVFTNSVSSEEIIHIVIGAVRLQMFKWRSSNFKFDIESSGNVLITLLLTLIANRHEK